jgi:hypothetical protein
MAHMTRKLFFIVTAAVCALAPAAKASQERWRVSEGLVGEPQGYWTIETQGEELKAYAEMFDAEGNRTTFLLTGKHENEEIVFDQESVDNEPKCAYRIKGSPTERGDPLTGVKECDGDSGSAEKATWFASKIPEQIE